MYSTGDYKFVDQLLVYDDFKFPWNFAIQNLLNVVELKFKAINNHKLLEYIEKCISSSNKDLKLTNSWIPYFKARSLDIVYEEKIKLYKKSADLGNHFAMLKYANYILDKNEKGKYLKLAVDSGNPEALLEYIIFYMRLCTFTEDQDDLDMWISTSGWSTEKKDRFRDQVLEDIKKFPVKLPLSKEDDLLKIPLDKREIYGYIATIYENLDNMYQHNRYSSEFTYYTLCSVGSNIHNFLENYSDKICKVIQENMETKIKYEELKKSYEELKKVKEMDFNDIVSSGVGEFL